MQTIKTLNKKINLVSKNIQLLSKFKIIEKVVIAVTLLSVIALIALTVFGYIKIGNLNKEIKEDQRIIAEGRLDELNALKEQYDNLILGIDSGNITLIPNIETKMTELFSIITKNKPSEVLLIGIDGQLKSSGEYTYRMEYSSSDRTVISGFLKRLQAEKIEYINISSISKSIVNDKVRWVFSVTVKIGGIANE